MEFCMNLEKETTNLQEREGFTQSSSQTTPFLSLNELLGKVMEDEFIKWEIDGTNLRELVNL